MFEHIVLEKYLNGETIEKSKNINDLWEDFYCIYCQVKSNVLSSAQIKQRTKEWETDFLNLYEHKHITPYIHSFVHHLHEFASLYGDVNQFNLQGLEKLNLMSHGQVFRGSNKQRDYLKQVLRKRNRIEVTCL